MAKSEVSHGKRIQMRCINPQQPTKLKLNSFMNYGE